MSDLVAFKITKRQGSFHHQKQPSDKDNIMLG